MKPVKFPVYEKGAIYAVSTYDDLLAATKRERIIPFRETEPLLDFPCSSGWPDTHSCTSNTNWARRRGRGGGR